MTPWPPRPARPSCVPGPHGAGAAHLPVTASRRRAIRRGDDRPAQLVEQNCTDCHHDGADVPSFKGALDPEPSARTSIRRRDDAARPPASSMFVISFTEAGPPVGAAAQESSAARRFRIAQPRSRRCRTRSRSSRSADHVEPGVPGVQHRRERAHGRNNTSPRLCGDHGSPRVPRLSTSPSWSTARIRSCGSCGTSTARSFTPLGKRSRRGN
jgi:hypothetical protein